MKQMRNALYYFPLGKERHPEDVKIHTDETGRNAERNY